MQTVVGLITLGTVRHDRGVGIEKRYFEVSRLILCASGCGTRGRQLGLLVMDAGLVDGYERVREQFRRRSGIALDPRITPFLVERDEIGSRIRARHAAEQSKNGHRQKHE
jgi:hypothetical protein